MNYKDRVHEAAAYISKCINGSPDWGLILGSGLGGLAEQTAHATSISYSEIPFFPRSTVSGHAGRLIVGEISDQTVCVMQGRVHYYEGYSLHEVVLPIFVMKRLGIKSLIITNAAGAINGSFSPGQIMLIKDHINLMGDNPLRGLQSLNWGPDFTNMVDAYSPNLRRIAARVAARLNIDLREGVYAALPGPTYETPAEIRFLRTIGADAVGMSTVPEVIVARYLGMQVLGFSCLTNMAAGLQKVLDHSEVKAIAAVSGPKLAQLLGEILKEVV